VTVTEREAGQSTPIAPPPLDKLREVRFAVVMYGGVSLAIYMNGVAQELLSLVRASAPSSTEGPERDHALPANEQSVPAASEPRTLRRRPPMEPDWVFG